MFKKCEIYLSDIGYVCPGKGICNGLKANGHNGNGNSPDSSPEILCTTNLMENGEFKLYNDTGICKIYEHNKSSFFGYWKGIGREKRFNK